MREPSSWTQRGPRRRIAWPDASVLPGSESRARAQSGFPRNVGDPAVSTDMSRLEVPGDQLQETRPRQRSAAGRAKHERRSGIAKRRQRSAAKWAAGSHSAPDSTVEAGELAPSSTRGREAGRRVTTPLDGNTRDALTSHRVSTQGQRIATHAFEATVRRCRSEGVT